MNRDAALTSRLSRLAAAASMAALLWLLSAGVGIPAAEVQVVELNIQDRTVSGPDVVPGAGAGAVRVKLGSQIELRWHSDEAAVVHLHGYDIETTIPTDGAATTAFQAKAPGRFPVEAHAFGGEHSHGHKVLLYVEVRP